tara:strand:+ start:2586 stop:2738 length:153 start_codon:yes stop_codon:yes gene_type:complete
MKDNEKLCAACSDKLDRLAHSDESGVITMINRMERDLQILKAKINQNKFK